MMYNIIVILWRKKTNYSKVTNLNNNIVDSFIDDNKLFALFETPAHVLFVDNYIDNINKYKDIFAQYNMGKNIFFSCKANKSFVFLHLAAKNGCGIEVSSKYELKDALKYTHKIIASGPAKDDEYITHAINEQVMISVDDIEELKRIKLINKPVNILLRISNTSQNIVSRFGININQIKECVNILKESLINLKGFSFHINNYDMNDRIQAIKNIINIVRTNKLEIEFIDIGGGFPIRYCSQKQWANFNKLVNSSMFFKNKTLENFYPYYTKLSSEYCLEYILRKTHKILNGIQLLIEPGRSLLNNCGISIYKVVYTKKISNDENLIITNGNINCLSEQWFNSDYLIEPRLITQNIKKEKYFASIAGNLCLEQDFLTWRKVLFYHKPIRDDLLIYYNTAGYQMDSNESTFHKIPTVSKYVVKKQKEKWIIQKDEFYDCK